MGDEFSNSLQRPSHFQAVAGSRWIPLTRIIDSWFWFCQADSLSNIGVTTKLTVPKRKEHTNPRIDADALVFFRRQGRGYQTRINAVLRSYVDEVTGHKLR